MYQRPVRLLALAGGLAGCMPHGPHWGWPGGFVGLIILVLDIWAIVHIVQSRRSAEYKLLWVVVILLLPLIGLILWLLLRDRRI